MYFLKIIIAIYDYTHRLDESHETDDEGKYNEKM